MKKKTPQVENTGILKKLDSFFEKYEKQVLWLSLSLGAIISILMFDSKVSLSGDDCDYIINAERFLHHFEYPGGRGSLYPIAISPFLIGGLNLILLKALSAVFILLSMFFMYKSFRGRIPTAILMPTLLITNICPYIFFYGSHTYSEPFFMFTQSLFIYFFFKYFVNDNQDSLNIKENWGKFLVIALCFLAMGLTRTIGYAVMGAVIVYFCFQKQWKNLAYSLAASGIVYALFGVIKKIVWPNSGAAYNINNYLAKNFYGVEQGMEDLPGFIDRLVANSHVYLSWFMYKFMGFRTTDEAPLSEIPLLTVFTYILFFVCIIAIYKRNKPLLFAGIYVGVMNFASFILLQSIWGQDRLVMIYYPLMLLFLLGGIYYLLRNKLIKLAWIYPVILAALFIGTSVHLKVKAEQNMPVLQQNIIGNDLYGLTPDWENFVKMSRWATDNLDKDAVIASRKPSISHIYTGRDFHGIYSVPYVGIGDIVKESKEDADNYIFLTVAMGEYLLDNMRPFTQYVFISKPNTSFSLNGKEIRSAIVYKIDKSLYSEQMLELLSSSDMNYTLDYDTFLKQYVDDNSIGYQVVSPDMLLNTIKESNIKYMILAKIRTYTPENTGMFVNTIHQYINFINMKYTDMFKFIHSIGKEETCEIVEFVG